MKRILLLAVITTSFMMTTGCAHKKRVQDLEAQILDCRDRKAQLSQHVDETPRDAELATATQAVRDE